jgi:hypothetical protein
MGLWWGKRRQPKVVQAPMDADEARRIAEAEAEMAEYPQPFEPEEENMPVGIFFPFLRKRNGLALKPLTQNGSLISRTADDVNAAIEHNRLRQMRQPRQD